MKKTILLPIFALSIELTGCKVVFVNQSSPQLNSVKNAVTLNSVEQFDIHTDLQKSYLSDEIASINNYASGVEELSKPKSLKLEFEVDEAALSYELYLSKDSEFADYKIYSTNETSVSINNLEIGETYYWKVKAIYSNGETLSSVSSFTTSNIGPRNIDVDGITNVRDLGGKVGLNGKRIKQGLIYRCGRLNRSWISYNLHEITSIGKATMKDDLGVKTEIDLRKSYQNENSFIRTSPLGFDVNYIMCPMEYGADNYLIDNAGFIASFFRTISNPAHLPAIFHCDIGTDRTGFMAYLCGALLGESEEDLQIDYLFSNFASIGDSRSLDGFLSKTAVLDSYPGSSLHEKVEAYLLSIGVWQKEIDSFINIML